ncbi:Dihydroxyacetone kinase-like protein, phosphatase domain / Dihydroxyacetone kinase-like protein, kinase domain [Oscillospiraceae bacterium]|nr:Dihydroxyacetone kinase-like protein, phosphatase domain / Dihydroxyacetone kinase-like protein, kinase domain [Oscillospiraceae bacterium]
MTLRHSMDGVAFGRMIVSASAAIELKKQKINELNVFPVPDGDTGTNMSMTLAAAAQDLKKRSPDSLTKAADMTASALLRGARGNSGVILSLLFRGFSKSLKGKLEASGKDFADALTAGVEAAYKAVMKPAEGTILTVSRLTADAARELAAQDENLESVLTGSIETAKVALENTVNQNPVLKKAGVVDAGGMGFVVILEGMLSSLQGNDITAQDASGETKEQADFTDFATEDITFAYDTVYIVRKKDENVSLEPLRVYLDSIGDSLVIGEDDEAFKVHVHTNIPWDALAESQKYGTLELAKIENMRMQHDDLAEGRKARSTDDLEAIEQELESGEAAAAQPAAPEKPFGFVAVCAGAGLAGVFRDLGADGIIEGGQTMNPSTEDILKAIEQTPAEVVFVLPNNKNIIMAAQAASELATREVVVVPTKTVPQGITAMLSFDETQSASENAELMTESLSGVTTMQITYAARNSDFEGRDIHEGEYLALYNGALLGNSPDLDSLLVVMAEKAAGEGKEFVNIFYGADTTAEQAAHASEIFTKALPSAEVNVLSGGQPIYYYLISAE